MKLCSLIPLAMLFNECYWPLPLVHDPAVSWSCVGLPHLGSIPLYASHYALATLQALSSPHTIICPLANSPVPMSSMKPTDWPHWLANSDLWSSCLSSLYRHTLSSLLRCPSHLNYFKDIATQDILNHTRDFCLCVWSSALDHWSGLLPDPPTSTPASSGTFST